MWKPMYFNLQKQDHRIQEKTTYIPNTIAIFFEGSSTQFFHPNLSLVMVLL